MVLEAYEIALTGQACLPLLLVLRLCFYGGLAQLARAPALQAGGQRFESVILHPGEKVVARRRTVRPLARREEGVSQPSIFDILTQARL